MTIECAVLGMLSECPLAGYDVKKRIQGSPLLPWSGNNNQVYRALSGLLEAGWVTHEVHHQEGAPSRKVYTITEGGRATLREWLDEPPEPMEPGKPLLARLRWVGAALGAARVDAMLGEYAQRLQVQLSECRPGSEREEGLDAALGALVDENVRMGFQAELDWTSRAREAIAEYVERDNGANGQRNGAIKAMQYEVVERQGAAYLHYRASAVRPESMDPTQFVGDCIERRANRVMIDEGALPERFYRLATGLAGEVMQKLGQYHVKAALLMDASGAKGKFKDMIIESNRGGAFRAFADADSAEAWLMEGEAR